MLSMWSVLSSVDDVEALQKSDDTSALPKTSPVLISSMLKSRNTLASSGKLGLSPTSVFTDGSNQALSVLNSDPNDEFCYSSGHVGIEHNYDTLHSNSDGAWSDANDDTLFSAYSGNDDTLYSGYCANDDTMYSAYSANDDTIFSMGHDDTIFSEPAGDAVSSSRPATVCGVKAGPLVSCLT